MCVTCFFILATINFVVEQQRIVSSIKSGVVVVVEEVVVNALFRICISADRQVHLAKDVPTEEAGPTPPKTFRSVMWS